MEMADVAPPTGTWPASMVSMPMMNVCASAAATRIVVAARPMTGVRLAKCQPYATNATR